MTYKAHIYYKDICICTVTYVESAECEFEYIFEPKYDVIDSLSGFKGIQGIDLDLRKDKYIRRNMIPTFIFEHNPMSGKKSFHKAERVNGKCLLEYLSYSNLRYFGDNLSIKP